MRATPERGGSHHVTHHYIIAYHFGLKALRRIYGISLSKTPIRHGVSSVLLPHGCLLHASRAPAHLIAKHIAIHIVGVSFGRPLTPIETCGCSPRHLAVRTRYGFPMLRAACPCIIHPYQWHPYPYCLLSMSIARICEYVSRLYRSRHQTCRRWKSRHQAAAWQAAPCRYRHTRQL